MRLEGHLVVWVMVLGGRVGQMTAAIPAQGERKATCSLARAVEPVVFQVFLAGEGREEAVTPLWEVGGS